MQSDSRSYRRTNVLHIWGCNIEKPTSVYKFQLNICLYPHVSPKEESIYCTEVRDLQEWMYGICLRHIALLNVLDQNKCAFCRVCITFTLHHWMSANAVKINVNQAVFESRIVNIWEELTADQTVTLKCFINIHKSHYPMKRLEMIKSLKCSARTTINTSLWSFEHGTA